jgi:hypothetical protein
MIALCKLIYPQNNIGITMGKILQLLFSSQLYMKYTDIVKVNYFTIIIL